MFSLLDKLTQNLAKRRAKYVRIQAWNWFRQGVLGKTVVLKLLGSVDLFFFLTPDIEWDLQKFCVAPGELKLSDYEITEKCPYGYFDLRKHKALLKIKHILRSFSKLKAYLKILLMIEDCL